MSNVISPMPSVNDLDIGPTQYLINMLYNPEVYSDDPDKRAVIREISDKLRTNFISGTKSVFGTSMSCGVSFLSGLGVDPKSIVDKILKERHIHDKNIREAFVVFSDIEDRNRGRTTGGDALCRYIKANGLGSIIETKARKNPNSGNKIKVWVWAPPHESLEKDDKYMPVNGYTMSINECGRAVYTLIEEKKPFQGPNVFGNNTTREA